MDLDCIGSIVLARYLYPGFIPVRSGRIHPVARNLYNLYESYLNFSKISDLKGQSVENIVIVDTRASDQVEEYFRSLDAENAKIEVFDHHPSDERCILGAVVHECSFGANTTQLVFMCIERNIHLSREDATIALAAIYADTGNFLHPNVCPQDLQAASFLLDSGAELSLLKDFLVPLREKKQIILFHEVLNKMETKIIRGHSVQLCYLELDEDTHGLGAVIEKVFEVENSEILFGFFFLTCNNRLLIIARNSCDGVNVNEILSDFGGGGHKQAASVTIKTTDGRMMYDKILSYLGEVLSPAATASDIMTKDVAFLRPDMSLLEASIYLEQVSHAGAPVLDEQGYIVGFLTLREIMKGRKLEKMKVPVSAFMIRSPVCVTPSTLLREIEEILYMNNIGHLPVLCEGKLVGLVTRTDFLNYMRGETGRKKLVLESMCPVLA